MSQTIHITGATGVIGRRAVRELVEAGHDVTGIVRSDAGRALLERLGARAVQADVYDRAALARAFDGTDVVVNLLTRIPPVERMGIPGAWKENDRLRTEASAVVARAAADAGAARIVQESVCYVYADGGAVWLHEDAPVEPIGPVAAAMTAEENARGEFPGETVILRFGAFLGPDTDQSRMHVTNARRGLSAWPSRRDAYVPTVWLDDAAAAVRAAIGAPAGTYNVVDDEPPTRAEIEAALAALAGRRKLRGLVAPVARAVPSMRPVARSLRLSNARLRDLTGWAPRLRGGIDGWALIAREAGV